MNRYIILALKYIGYNYQTNNNHTYCKYWPAFEVSNMTPFILSEKIEMFGLHNHVLLGWNVSQFGNSL